MSRREKRRNVGKDGGMSRRQRRRSTRKEDQGEEGGMEKMKRIGMERLEKKNGKRQLVWRLEEKLGSDTEGGELHALTPSGQCSQTKGLIRQG